MEVSRVEQHAYMKIAVLRGRNAMECFSELGEALGNNALPYRTVAWWLTPCPVNRTGIFKKKIVATTFAPTLVYIITQKITPEGRASQIGAKIPYGHFLQ
ncbi:hypothetical protein TNCV_2433201 [Trichonephila clavipes]|nr:hypothetical protein TNCV_2433201 [Trichonephila clavipes]